MGNRDQTAHDDDEALAIVSPPRVDATIAGFRGAPGPTDCSTERPAHARRGMPVPVAPPETRLQPVRLPSPSRAKGRLVQLRELARDIVEVTIALNEPMRILPGQYCSFSFAGLPHRPFSPTASLGAIREDSYIRLHVKRVRGGGVTPRLGTTIKVGHPVEIVGPYGRAFLRPASHRRLVMIGSGTGFAPIWAIAASALRETPSRPMILVGAARTLDSFYMASALELARGYPSVSILAVVDEIAAPWHGFVPGPPVAHLPKLSSDDIVYAAGEHALVGAVGKAAAIAGATFHADPLEPAPQSHESWMTSARRWLRAG
ncbi:MAG: FAD-binding oxidoreductase [Hyphomicrobiaceae bacterium]